MYGNVPYLYHHNQPVVSARNTKQLHPSKESIMVSTRQGGDYTPEKMNPLRIGRKRGGGIPCESEISSGEDDAITVEKIMQSLTRAKGIMLSQTLLSPSDNGCGDGDISPAKAAAAWNAIGGLADVKESLLNLAFPLLPMQFLDLSVESDKHYGGLLANPPGVLLFGPPGCGKSLLVRALALAVGAQFLVVSPSCLLRKYSRETNLNVRALFLGGTEGGTNSDLC